MASTARLRYYVVTLIPDADPPARMVCHFDIYTPPSQTTGTAAMTDPLDVPTAIADCASDADVDISPA